MKIEFNEYLLTRDAAVNNVIELSGLKVIDVRHADFEHTGVDIV